MPVGLRIFFFCFLVHVFTVIASLFREFIKWEVFTCAYCLPDAFTHRLTTYIVQDFGWDGGLPG